MTEQEYDSIVAPQLLELAEKIRAMGGSIVARVEWSPGNIGITTNNVTEKSGAGQILTNIAALSKGNIDAMLIEAMKRLDYSQSIFLHKYAQNGDGDFTL